MLADLLKLLPRSTVSTDEDLKKHCTYKIGGKADFYIVPHSVYELIDCVRYLTDSERKYYILGKGANTLFPDEGYRGAVISMLGLTGLSATGKYVFADAGASGAALSAFCTARELSGVEFLAGIPCSIGGAVKMNAGAYGCEIADILKKIWVLRGGKVLSCEGKELEMSHRKCGFLQSDDIVLSAAFELTKGDRDRITAVVQELNAKRRKSQPLDLPSCGSVFKRPKEGYAAAFIDSAGLKGKTIGGAKVSDKHSGFIVNFDGAKCRDVLKLVDYIKKEVYNIYNVILETEVVTVE